LIFLYCTYFYDLVFKFVQSFNLRGDEREVVVIEAFPVKASGGVRGGGVGECGGKSREREREVCQFNFTCSMQCTSWSYYQ
jgi:hypothetical protein